MGSPISDLLAEFKFRSLELNILNELRVRPSFCVRYGDDIFVI